MGRWGGRKGGRTRGWSVKHGDSSEKTKNQKIKKLVAFRTCNFGCVLGRLSVVWLMHYCPPHSLSSYSTCMQVNQKKL